jgi:hypothetical protein
LPASGPNSKSFSPVHRIIPQVRTCSTRSLINSPESTALSIEHPVSSIIELLTLHSKLLTGSTLLRPEWSGNPRAETPDQSGVLRISFQKSGPSRSTPEYPGASRTKIKILKFSHPKKALSRRGRDAFHRVRYIASPFVSISVCALITKPLISKLVKDVQR